jgi:hypothetical protein
MAGGMAEKRRVHRGREYGPDPDLTALESQFAPDRLTERADGSLRTRVGRHQRQAMECDGGANIDDAAVAARPHMSQRYPRAVDGAMVGHVRHPLELRLGHIAKATIDAVARAIDPYIDRAEHSDNRVSGRAESDAVRYVREADGHAPTGCLHFPAGGREALSTARYKPDPPALPGEEGGGTLTDAGRPPSDDDDRRGCFTQCECPGRREVFTIIGRVSQIIHILWVRSASALCAKVVRSIASKDMALVTSVTQSPARFKSAGYRFRSSNARSS